MELTLERIAELRALLEKPSGTRHTCMDEPRRYVEESLLASLLDAAEQWLELKLLGDEVKAIPQEVVEAACAESQLHDRKAAAFDALAAMLRKEGCLLLRDYSVASDPCVRIGIDPECYGGGMCDRYFESKSLLEAVEAMQQHIKEPTNG